jgi:hypothetical protein
LGLYNFFFSYLRKQQPCLVKEKNNMATHIPLLPCFHFSPVSGLKLPGDSIIAGKPLIKNNSAKNISATGCYEVMLKRSFSGVAPFENSSIQAFNTQFTSNKGQSGHLHKYCSGASQILAV